MREAQIRSACDRLLRRLMSNIAARPSAPTVAQPAPAPAGITAVSVVATSSAPTPVSLSVADRRPAVTLAAPVGDPARVLLVATDRRFRALAATLLSQRGHTVIVDRGDDDVSALAHRERADVILIDASASLTAAARQVARLSSLRPRVAIVAVSAEFGTSTLAALPVISKWSSFDEVLSAVDAACASARLTRNAA